MMTRLAVETPFRPAPRTLQFSTSARPHSAPARKSFDDAGAALSEAEVSELAVRLTDVRSEAEFDHLLGAILTHAAMRAGGWLPGVVGSALGGLLKSIARQDLSRPAAARALGLELEGLDRNEREFEAAMQFRPIQKALRGERSSA